MAFKHVLIAPNAFKETYSGSAIASLIEQAFKPLLPGATFVKAAIADGGDGSLDALRQSGKGTMKPVEVIGPYGKKVKSAYLSLDDRTSFVEMASASGLALTSEEERDVMEATSYGLGQLIKASIDDGSTRIIVGIGGSATNDGGIGMAQALGARFLSRHGKELAPVKRAYLAAEDLMKVAAVDTDMLDALFEGVEVIIASDVDNPLLGPQGATAIYGPQKGASPENVKTLDAWLKRYAGIVESHYGKSYRNIKGAGAAGGVGFALMAYAKAEVKSGFKVISDLICLDHHLEEVDLIITGEGRIDRQSAMGKGSSALAARAKPGQTVIVIAGTVGEGYDTLFDHHAVCIGYFRSPDAPFDPTEVRKATPALLKKLAAAMASSLQQGREALQGKTFLAEGYQHG